MPTNSNAFGFRAWTILLVSCLVLAACGKGPVKGVPVEVPVRIKVHREREKITVKPIAFETVRILAAPSLSTGLRVEQKAGADEKSLSTGTIMVTGGSKFDLPGSFQPYSDSRLRDAQGCVVQCKVTIFETDAPVESHWMPESGQAYKVLWEKTFTEKVSEK